MKTIDIIMLVLFVAFVVFMVRGVVLQTQERDRKRAMKKENFNKKSEL
ncbi:hypothetical protein [Campylobacter curvus]|nr:hypothetical protein [Campylobacter curvus]